MARTAANLDVEHMLDCRLSRRRAIVRWGAASTSFMGAWPGWPGSAGVTAAPPRVAVSPPLIVRDGCIARVSVQIALTRATIDHRYELVGELWEADDPDGEPDRCCALDSRRTAALETDRVTVVLEGRFLTRELGLEKGVGPAGDETYSPDLAEIFARVWVRDLTLGTRYGPWDSPLRVAVAQDTRDWTGTRRSSGDALAIPRGSGPDSPTALPPRACTP
jgi:hypothetical protein